MKTHRFDFTLDVGLCPANGLELARQWDCYFTVEIFSDDAAQIVERHFPAIEGRRAYEAIHVAVRNEFDRRAFKEARETIGREGL